MSAKCLAPAITSVLIEDAAKRAMQNLKNKKAPQPFRLQTPICMTIEFEQSEMADKAAIMPFSKRNSDRRVEYRADDMVTIYRAFRTMLALAR